MLTLPASRRMLELELMWLLAQPRRSTMPEKRKTYSVAIRLTAEQVDTIERYIVQTYKPGLRITVADCAQGWAQGGVERQVAGILAEASEAEAGT